MKKFKFDKYVPITKVDDEERMVFGYASTPEIDSDGEVIKTEAFEKALPNYMKFPTIREMHQPKPVGTTKQTDINKKGFYIGAKIVSDEAWKLVKEKVYAGFSIGGNVIKRVGNVIHEIDLVEISLVDVPANKGAVIELWKKDKISKDAETVYSMASLMIQVKDKISYYRYLGKDTKKLEKILDMLKQIISQEALEPETDPTDEGEGIFASDNPEVTKLKISLLEAMDFSDNPLADSLRKGVIIGMNKAKELKKEDDPKKEEVEETQTEGQETEETGTEEEKEESTEDKTDVEETGTEEEKETGEADPTLKKLQEVSKKLEKVAPAKPVVKKEDATLAKSVSSMAGILAKAVDVISDMGERLAKLENTPAASKGKSAVVLKQINAGGGEEPAENTEKVSGELATKKARLAELTKLYDTMTPNEFAKAGHSKEAMDLEKSIGLLEAAQQ